MSLFKRIFNIKSEEEKRKEYFEMMYKVEQNFLKNNNLVISKKYTGNSFGGVIHEGELHSLEASTDGIFANLILENGNIVQDILTYSLIEVKIEDYD